MPQRVEQVLIAVGLACVLSAAFYCLDWYHARLFTSGYPFWQVGFAWEESIRFRPEWIWIYLAYFPFCFLPLFFREVRNDRSLFRRTALGYAAQYGLAFLIFLQLPIRMEQPKFVAESWSAVAVDLVFRLDPGFNIFPSLHASNTVFVACIVWKLRGVRLGTGAWVLSGLICLSTLFVKQHYAVNLFLGWLLGALVYRLSFRERHAETAQSGLSVSRAQREVVQAP